MTQPYTIKKDERCNWIDYFTELTDGRYQKRCPNSANYRIFRPDSKRGYDACGMHAEIYISNCDEELTITRLITPEEVQEMSERYDRLEVLHKMPYAEYLLTPEWQERRQHILERDGYRCQICNSPKHLNVHHRDYTRRGYEKDSDLTTLCQGCHQVFHENSRLARVEV